MKQNRVISTAVLVLFLGVGITAFAQKGNEKKGEGRGKAQQAQRQQHMQKAQPQRARKSQPQHAQPIAQNRGNNGNHYGRISDDHYRANFGHGHSFHMVRPQMISGYNRFQYGGYWFGFNQGWPSGWSYDDDVYVEYVGSTYYMYNVRHPGIHITLNLF
jgi:hypothetical protein